MYNPDTFKPASPRSAAEQEDAAMEESEEVSAQDSNQQVTSLAARPEDSDSGTCSPHPSQREEANSSIAEDPNCKICLDQCKFPDDYSFRPIIFLMTTHFAQSFS